MIAVMAVVCLTASAQKMRHGAGKITVQPMIGLSSGYLRGEEETANGTVKYENNEARTGLITLDLRGAAAITKLNKNGDKVKWYNDGGMLTIGYKFEIK